MLEFHRAKQTRENSGNIRTWRKPCITKTANTHVVECCRYVPIKAEWNSAGREANSDLASLLGYRRYEQRHVRTNIPVIRVYWYASDIEFGAVHTVGHDAPVLNPFCREKRQKKRNRRICINDRELVVLANGISRTYLRQLRRKFKKNNRLKEFF